jgi:hypothetical protein
MWKYWEIYIILLLAYYIINAIIFNNKFIAAAVFVNAVPRSESRENLRRVYAFERFLFERVTNKWSKPKFLW